MTQQRECHKCGKTKPLVSFSRDASKPLGRRFICKECVAQQSAVYLATKRAAQVASPATVRPVQAPRAEGQVYDLLRNAAASRMATMDPRLVTFTDDELEEQARSIQEELEARRFSRDRKVEELRSDFTSWLGRARRLGLGAEQVIELVKAALVVVLDKEARGAL